MMNTHSKDIHCNASDGASERLLRPPPMLCITHRNASLPPIGSIRTEAAKHRNRSCKARERMTRSNRIKK